MRYLLSIGSNAPEAEKYLAMAEKWLGETFTQLESSGVYTTAAMNGRSRDYLNMVVRGCSDLDVTALTASAKYLERLAGRTPQSKLRGAIELDIDVIAAGAAILRPNEYTRAYFLQGLNRLKAE